MSGDPERWAGDLASWAIPPAIRARAVEDPWALPVAAFSKFAEEASGRHTPSRARALQALARPGSVLDVGCGAGAASLALVPQATRIVGVDENDSMLAAFEALASAAGVALESVVGRWPDVASAAGPADVVVCHHVAYNVPDIVPFIRELTSHAHRRVVLEMTAQHPRIWTNPFWREFHGIERPGGPVADDLAAIIRDTGAGGFRSERWQSPFAITTDLETMTTFLRTFLCLPPERDADVRAALERKRPAAVREMVTFWWDGGAAGS